MLSIIGSIFAGGATGLLGMIFQRAFDWLNQREIAKQKKQDQDFELAKKRIDIEVTQAEWSGRVKVAAEEASAAKDVAESNAFSQSLMKEPERYSETKLVTPGQNWLLVLLDVLRGSIRPLLTVYLCALTTYIWWQVRQLIQTEDLESKDVLEIWRMVVNTILYLTTTCILWWFGTRNKGQQPRIG